MPLWMLMIFGRLARLRRQDARRGCRFRRRLIDAIVEVELLFARALPWTSVQP
jgi:hypothetical protein